MSDPNALVPDENGVLRRVQLVSNQAGTVVYQDNPNSTNATVIDGDGNPHRVQLVYDVGGGSGGSDPHNKGWYATPEALEEDIPEGEGGDYAIIGSTDTIWVWDVDTSAWVDTDQKGQVESVNSKTGAVVLDAADVKAVPQLSVMPTATAANVNMIVQYTGTTNQNYTNGYFYKSGVSGTEIVDGNCTITSYENGEGQDPGSQYYPTFVFDKSVFDAYLVSQSATPNTGTSITFDLATDDDTGDNLLVAHYNTDDSVSTMLIDVEGEGLNQTYAILGFTTNFADPEEDPETADQQLIFVDAGHITVSLPTENTYGWERIDVQPDSGGAQYEYTAELEFTPNVDTEGAIIIELAADNVATLQIGQYVSYEDGGVWDDPVEDAVYTAFMQPSLDTSVGASKILWTSPVNRLIYMEGYAGTGQNEESILTLKYQYNDSGLAEDHCKIVLKIISDKELTITATKDPNEFVMDTSAGIMSLPIPLYQESDQTLFYPVQQGGLINWQPIPQLVGLPSQTGQSGKFLTTDGTDASWSNKPLVNTSTATNSLTILGNATSGSTYTNRINIGVGSVAKYADCMAIGTNAKSEGDYSIAIGRNTNIASGSAYHCIALGNYSTANSRRSMALGTNATSSADYAIAIGCGSASARAAQATAIGSIQLGSSSTDNGAKNSDANTFKVANTNGNFEMMSADGTIPSDRLVHAINKYSSMPTAGIDNLGWIVQYTGTTDSTYTHGHLYECVSDGGNPATYSWTEVSMGGGGSSYTAGTGIDITSGVISVTTPTLQNAATMPSAITILGAPSTTSYYTGSINIGVGSDANSDSAVSVGYSAISGSNCVTIGHNASTAFAIGGNAIGNNASAAGYSVAIGRGARATNNNAMQIALVNGATNSDRGTVKIANHNGNFEMMSADGTIPTDRYTTTPVADGTYVPTLTISSGVATRSWAAPGGGGGSTSATALLDEMGWSGNSQTVNVTGVTASNNVIVAAAPASQSDYSACGIICTAQGAGTLTFTCDTVPATGITVNVLII